MQRDLQILLHAILRSMLLERRHWKRVDVEQLADAFSGLCDRQF
jgi:hypothetical protein